MTVTYDTFYCHDCNCAVAVSLWAMHTKSRKAPRRREAGAGRAVAAQQGATMTPVRETLPDVLAIWLLWLLVVVMLAGMGLGAAC
jgi:hypothetical protein